MFYRMFHIALINNKRKPIFRYNTDIGYTMDIMVDTGASISVYDDSLVPIQSAFTGAYLSNDKIIVSSVDRSLQADLWVIPEFKLGKVIFHNVPVVCRDLSRFKVNMFISSELFHIDGFAVCYRTNQMVIGDDRKDVWCGLKYNIDKEHIIDHFYVFANETE